MSFEYLDDLFDQMSRLKGYAFAFDASRKREHLFDQSGAAFRAASSIASIR